MAARLRRRGQHRQAAKGRGTGRGRGEAQTVVLPACLGCPPPAVREIVVEREGGGLAVEGHHLGSRTVGDAGSRGRRRQLPERASARKIAGTLAASSWDLEPSLLAHGTAWPSPAAIPGRRGAGSGVTVATSDGTNCRVGTSK